MDPRLYNGAIFIGLDSPVVKSHGGADALSFASAIDIAYEFSKEGVGDKIIKGIDNLKSSREVKID